MASTKTKLSMEGPGIRLSLAALTIGCILPIIAIAVYLIFNIYERQQAQLIENTINRVKSISSAVDRDIAIIQSTLQALSNAASIDRDDLADFQVQASETGKSLNISNIVLVYPSGKVIMSTIRPLGSPLPDIDATSPVRRTINSQKPEVSDLFLGQIMKQFIYTISVPVQRNGQVRYSIGAAITNERLANILREQRLPGSWNVMISDSVGNVVVKSGDSTVSLGKKISPKLMQQLNTSTEQVFESVTQEGVPVLVVYSQSPTTKWLVSVYLPLSEVKGNRNALNSIILTSLVAIFLGFALAWFVGGRIAGSVTALIEPARALGSRIAVRIPPLFFKEANALRQALVDAELMLQSANYKAHHDALTGLANRSMFEITAEQQLLICVRNRTPLSILYIDLDGFKAVNDTYGHAVGDLLLKEVAARIKKVTRHSDIGARLGGDEFAIALIKTNISHAKTFAQNLLATLSKPYQLGDTQAHISASIGIASFPVLGDNLQTLLEAADEAMYQAKKAGKGRVVLADPTKTATG